MTLAPAARIRAAAARVDAATPASRDRTVDALRALAICGVILGHWMVTALVLTHGRAGDTLHDASPLAAMPALTPVSWIFQTLAVFFCVGGYAAARSYRGGYLPWVRGRLVRLSRPVAMLVAVWVPLGTGLWLAGVPGPTLHTVGHAGARPAVVPWRVRGADRADPGCRRTDPPARRGRGADPAGGRGRHASRIGPAQQDQASRHLRRPAGVRPRGNRPRPPRASTSISRVVVAGSGGWP